MTVSEARDHFAEVVETARSEPVYLARHGSVLGSESRRFIGHLDVPLSPRGEAEAAALARRLARAPLAAAYSSDLVRTRRTAEIVCAPHGIAAEPLPAWRPAPRDLDRILSCRYSRIVARDNTVRLGTRWLQIPPGPRGHSYAGCRVELRELLDGRLVVLYQDTLLAAQPAPAPTFVLTPRSDPGRDLLEDLMKKLQALRPAALRTEVLSDDDIIRLGLELFCAL